MDSDRTIAAEMAIFIDRRPFIIGIFTIAVHFFKSSGNAVTYILPVLAFLHSFNNKKSGLILAGQQIANSLIFNLDNSTWNKYNKKKGN